MLNPNIIIMKRWTGKYRKFKRISKRNLPNLGMDRATG